MDEGNLASMRKKGSAWQFRVTDREFEVHALDYPEVRSYCVAKRKGKCRNEEVKGIQKFVFVMN